MRLHRGSGRRCSLQRQMPRRPRCCRCAREQWARPTLHQRRSPALHHHSLRYRRWRWAAARWLAAYTAGGRWPTAARNRRRSPHPPRAANPMPQTPHLRRAAAGAGRMVRSTGAVHCARGRAHVRGRDVAWRRRMHQPWAPPQALGTRLQRTERPLQLHFRLQRQQLRKLLPLLALLQTVRALVPAELHPLFPQQPIQRSDGQAPGPHMPRQRQLSRPLRPPCWPRQASALQAHCWSAHARARGRGHGCDHQLPAMRCA